MIHSGHQIDQKAFRRVGLILLISVILLPAVAAGQVSAPGSVQQRIDSLKNISLETLQTDAAIDVLKQVTQNYFTGIYQLDSAKKYAGMLYELGEREGNDRGVALGQYYLGRVADGKGDFAAASEYLTSFLQSNTVKADTLLLANGLYSMANLFIHQGDLEEALNYQLRVLRLDEISGDSANIGLSLNNLGIIMKELNRNPEAIEYLERTQSIFEQLGDESNVAMALSNLGGLYAAEGDQGKALQAFRRSFELYSKLEHERGVALALEHIGSIQGDLGQFTQALANEHRALAIKKKLDLKKEIAESFLQLALVHKKMENVDSARSYFTQGLDMAQKVGDKKSIRRAYKELSDLEASRQDFRKAYDYFIQYHNTSDSILNESIANRISQLETRYGVEKKEAEINNLRERQKLSNRLSQTLMWALVATTVMAVVMIGFLIYRARSNRRMLELEQQQKRDLEVAYEQLKSTQSQLIQSEKMASLGELTAGIAHEIQNPLNFVNNFSEINEELAEELKSGLTTDNRQLTTQLADEIVENSKKISHHGKRADAIVKGMLQHSRASTGQKEPTDINALCDEYLRLAYHGLRARDKSFKASFEADLDPGIGKISIVPQDIGRVLLNLINNAFHAASEKTKQNIPGFEPTVILKTSMLPPSGDRGASVEISVSDNGPGIPDAIKEKIFQPFFTTKPTGQGTGLGLSLSYDIVKAHGGSIEMETRKEEGSTFKINLPGI